MLVKYKAWKHLHGVTMEASSLSLSSVLISHPAQHKQIKRTSTPPKYPARTPEATPQYPTRGITHSENERFLYVYEGYGGCM